MLIKLMYAVLQVFSHIIKTKWIKPEKQDTYNIRISTIEIEQSTVEAEIFQFKFTIWQISTFVDIHKPNFWT